jgi:hypothetical protein
MDRVVSGLARDASDASRRMSDSGMGERDRQRERERERERAREGETKADWKNRKSLFSDIYRRRCLVCPFRGID